MTAIADRTERARHDCVIRAVREGAALLALIVAVSGLARIANAAELEATLSYRVVGDGILEALVGTSGDAARGRALIAAREPANCVLCHAVPDAAIPFAGDLGPALTGIGTRLTTSQLRLRVMDNLRINPATIMPSYYRIDGLDRVAPAYRGKPILTAPQIEDIVAWLATLR